MTHPDFFKIVEVCSNTFIKTMIQTNGTYIDEDVAKFFLKKVFMVLMCLFMVKRIAMKD